MPCERCPTAHAHLSKLERLRSSVVHTLIDTARASEDHLVDEHFTSRDERPQQLRKCVLIEAR